MPVTAIGDSWQAQVNHKGQRYRRNFGTKKEAAIWEAESKAGLLRGEAPRMETSRRANTDLPVTLGELLDYVFRHHWETMRGGAKARIQAAGIVGIIGAALPIHKLTRAHVDRARTQLLGGGNAQATVNRKVACLSKMLSMAAELDIIPAAMKLPKYAEAEHRVRRFTVEEERAALTFFERIGNDTMADYVVLSLDTGLRQGEVLSLRPANVHNGRLTVFGTDAKSKRSRTVPLTQRAAQVFAKRAEGVKPQEPIFPALNQSSIHHYWNRLSQELDLEADAQFVPHVMRHEFCSRLADLGRNAAEIMKLAGHSSLSVTQRYIHINGSTLDAAIQALEGRARAPVDTTMDVLKTLAKLGLLKDGLDVSKLAELVSV